MSAGWRSVVVLVGVAFAGACSSNAGQPGTGVPTPEGPASSSAIADGPMGQCAYGMRHAARDTAGHCAAGTMGRGADGTGRAAHGMRHDMHAARKHAARKHAAHGMTMRRGSGGCAAHGGPHARAGGSAQRAPERGSLAEMVGPNTPVAADESALPAGEGASDFRTACARCHVLPDPVQHAPGAWSAVVERMRENMERMGVPGIDEVRARRIVEYLRGAAGRPDSAQGRTGRGG